MDSRFGRIMPKTKFEIENPSLFPIQKSWRKCQNSMSRVMAKLDSEIDERSIDLLKSLTMLTCWKTEVSQALKKANRYNLPYDFKSMWKNMHSMLPKGFIRDHLAHLIIFTRSEQLNLTKVYEHILDHDAVKGTILSGAFQQQKEVFETVSTGPQDDYQSVLLLLTEKLKNIGKTIDDIGDKASKQTMKASLPIDCQTKVCYCVFEDRGFKGNYVTGKVVSVLQSLQSDNSNRVHAEMRMQDLLRSLRTLNFDGALY